MSDKLDYLMDYADSLHSASTVSASNATAGNSFHGKDQLQQLKMKHSTTNTSPQQLYQHNHHLSQFKYDQHKFESLVKTDFETLQKKYSDLLSAYGASQQEIFKMGKSLDLLSSERNSAVKERDGLRQQCSAAIRQWDKALRENNETKEQLVKVQQQRDDALKKINQEMALRIKAAKDLSRLTEERNAAFQEYNLIMSERDSVHKEIERLSEELNEQQKKNKQVESERKALMEELEQLKKDFIYGGEKNVPGNRDPYSGETSGGGGGGGGGHRWGSSSSGIASSWAMQGSHYSKGTTSAVVNNHKDSSLLSSMSSGPYLFRQKTLSTSNSSSVSNSSHNAKPSVGTKPNDGQQHRLIGEGTTVMVTTAEVEMLRKQVDLLQQDLMEMQQELDSCRRERDLVCNERDKIVQERESVRLLSDKLRRERDRAIRDLAEALRDLDDTRRQKSEVLIELCEFKEQLSEKNNNENENKENDQTAVSTSTDQHNLHTYGENTGNSVVVITTNNNNNNSSRDSAISSDIQDFDFEHTEVKLMNKFKSFVHPPDWGFDVTCRDKQVLVCSVAEDGPGGDVLFVSDVILKVNSIPVDSEEFCRRLLNECFGEVRLLLKRRKHLLNACLQLRNDKPHGIVCEQVYVIRQLLPNSVAAEHGALAVGDILNSVNNVQVSSDRDLNQLINSDDQLVNVQVYRGNLINFFKLRTLSDNLNQSKYESGGFRSYSTTESTCDPNSSRDSRHSPGPLSPIFVHTNSKKAAKRAKEAMKENNLLKDQSNNLEELHQHFGQVDKPHGNLLDRAYHKIFGKSHKSKVDRQKQQDDRSLRNSSFVEDEKETLDALNQVLDDYSNGKKDKKGTTKNKSDNGGTWPKYRPSTSVVFPTYNQHKASVAVVAAASTMYHPSKKKERKSLSIFTNHFTSRPNAKESLPVEMASSIPKQFVGGNKSDSNNAYNLYLNHQYAMESGNIKANHHGPVGIPYKAFPDLYKRQHTQPQFVTRELTPISISEYQSPLKSKEKKDSRDFLPSSVASSLSSYSNPVMKERNGKKYTINDGASSSAYAKYDPVPSGNLNHSAYLQKDKSAYRRHLDSRFMNPINSLMYQHQAPLPTSPSTSYSYTDQEMHRFNHHPISPDESQNSAHELTYNVPPELVSSPKKFVSNSFAARNSPLNFTFYPSNDEQSTRDPLRSSSKSSTRPSLFSTQFVQPSSLMSGTSSRHAYAHLENVGVTTNNRSLDHHRNSKHAKLQTFAPLDIRPQATNTTSTTTASSIDHHQSSTSHGERLSEHLSLPSEHRFAITPSPCSSMYSNEILNSSPLQSMDIAATSNAATNLHQQHHHHHHLLHHSQVRNLGHHRHSPSFPMTHSKHHPNASYVTTSGVALTEKMLLLPKHQAQRSTPNPTTDPSLNAYGQQEGTFSKRNQRIRISSNNSVNSKISNCSIDKSGPTESEQMFHSLPPNADLRPSQQSSFLYQIEWLNRPNRQIKRRSSKGSPSVVETGAKEGEIGTSLSNIPSSGDIRSIYIERSNEPLGIQISNMNGNNDNSVSPGIFISTVTTNSLAAQVGLQVGDQLLEICGINMRSANYDAAANVLRQCGNTINIKVQYMPDIFQNSKKSSVHSDQVDCGQSGNESEEVEERRETGNKSFAMDSLKNRTHATVSHHRQRLPDSYKNRSDSEEEEETRIDSQTSSIAKEEHRLLTNHHHNHQDKTNIGSNDHLDYGHIDNYLYF